MFMDYREFIGVCIQCVVGLGPWNHIVRNRSEENSAKMEGEYTVV